MANSYYNDGFENSLVTVINVRKNSHRFRLLIMNISFLSDRFTVKLDPKVFACVDILN